MDNVSLTTDVDVPEDNPIVMNFIVSNDTITAQSVRPMNEYEMNEKRVVSNENEENSGKSSQKVVRRGKVNILGNWLILFYVILLEPSHLTYTCSKSTIEMLKKVWNMFKVKRRSSVFIVNFEHISHLSSVFLLLTWKKQILAGIVLYLLPQILRLKPYPEIFCKI